MESHLTVMLHWWQIIYLSCKKKALKVFLLVSHLPLVGSIVSELYGKRNPISFYPSTIAQIDWNGEKGIIETFHYPKEDEISD